jgi:hypothetical protein
MANSTEMKRVQAGELSYQEQSAAAAVRARLEMDGVSAEKSMALKQVSQWLCEFRRSRVQISDPRTTILTENV